MATKKSAAKRPPEQSVPGEHQARSVLRNQDIAELLARAAEDASRFVQRAYRRAARAAFLWPREAAEVVAAGESLTSLPGVGPFLDKQIRAWTEKPVRRMRPPLIRRDFLSLTSARATLVANENWAKRLRGDLQMHTNWSDGSGTIKDMQTAAEARGYAYIAITDHSKGLKIAGGISERDLRQQAGEIDAANARRSCSCRVLKSIEMNLTPNGEGDLEPSALVKLDLVLGSFHSVLRVKHDQTSRYLTALRNPHLHILGHPRGRIYNFRLGLSADWPRVFAEATRLDKAVEIDCYPDRQDLNLGLLKIAKGEGTRISLGTDAHHPWQLEFIEFGLAAALLAKLQPERIINFLSVDELQAWVDSVRRRER